jgi:hypothetical protein
MFGYTIGATNVLFKQRLYEDLDAFVDELDIDLKNNEQLKKQLQLTTADLRFADYIIKHVNVSKSTASGGSSADANLTGPTLLSFKKTNPMQGHADKQSTQSSSSDFLNVNMDNSLSSSPTASTSWEGSDEWIRLNFKWYLFTLLGSVVKEELYNVIRSELDFIYTTTNSNSNSDSNTNYRFVHFHIIRIFILRVLEN